MIIWRVYAIYNDKHYIVEEFGSEDEASDFCQEHNWQLIDKSNRIYQLTFKRCWIKNKKEFSTKELLASTFIAIGLFSLVLAGGSENLSVIGTFSIAGIISAALGCDILEV